MSNSRIAIIGAGQAGSLLALMLRAHHYNVTLYNDRSTEQIKHGHIFSSQVTFHASSKIEQEEGLKDLYEKAPENNNILINIVNGSIEPFVAKMKNPYYSIDLRLKTATCIDLFVKLGGVYKIEKMDLERIHEISKDYDLIIIASGKSTLNNIFPINHEETLFTQSKRNYCCIYVNNINQIDSHRGLRINLLPKVGEFFTVPGLTISGSCEMLLFEAIHGSHFDFWNNEDSNEITLLKAIEVLKEYLPLEAERLKHATLTDKGAVLTGSYPPLIRHPVGRLESGKCLLGIADAVVLNDPIAGQGANNAIKAVKVYSDAIINNANQDFNEDWMRHTFQKFWQSSGKHSTILTNTFLMPESDRFKKIVNSLSNDKNFSTKLVDCFDKPEEFVTLCHSI